MKAVQFDSRLNADKTLSVPPAVASDIPQGQAVRVLVLFADHAEDQDWERLAASEFAKGYADSDAIYDQLSSR
jgi:hypothetical protein